MREIKFRAKRTDNGEWIYGYYCNVKVGHPTITVEDGGSHQVNPETVGQFIDLKDKNGIKIYEGDISEIDSEDGGINRFIVKYGITQREMASGWIVDIPCYYFDLIDGNFKAFPIVINWAGIHDLKMLKVIGNTHDNPELLKD